MRSNYATGTGAMWEQDFTLPAADQAKTLTGITFQGNNAASGGPILNIWAISGVAIFDSPVFANNVNVTANSTIDVPTVASTMGALSVKPCASLSITGKFPRRSAVLP